MLLEARDAVFGYAGRPVVRVDCLRLHPGRGLGVYGPNGSGKTTLVRGLTGLLAPMSGSVDRNSHLQFGYLPQHRALEMHWPMSGLDAAAMAASARRRFGWIARDRDRIREAMERLGVADLSNRSFAKLSGGQQQRLMLAGALAAAPDLLVLDEPTDGLDARSRTSLLDSLKSAMSRGLALIVISHDIDDLNALCDEIASVYPRDVDEPSAVDFKAVTR